MSSNRDPQALQDLWGLQDGGNEDDDYDEDEDDDDDNVAANSKFRSERAEQNERIKGMRAGTGELFPVLYLVIILFTHNLSCLVFCVILKSISPLDIYFLLCKNYISSLCIYL